MDHERTDDGVLIEARDLRRAFTRRGKPEVVAVRDLSFDIAAGETVGLLGPNGAGKSTTVKMLTGILVPSSGRLRVAGVDPQRRRVELARRIGVVFGQRTTLWWDLPLRDSLDLLARVHRLDRTAAARTRADLVELLDLGDLLDTPVRQLSLGQRVRGDLAAALQHRPGLLYLDEPTIGLDIASKARLRSFLAELNAAEGTTVLLTTHDLDDVEALCRRVLVIDHGTMVFDGDLPRLHVEGGSRRTLVVDLAAEQAPLDLPGLAAHGAEVVRVEGRRQWVSFPADASAAPLVGAIAARHEIADLSVREPAIEDVITRLYARGEVTPRG